MENKVSFLCASMYTCVGTCTHTHTTHIHQKTHKTNNSGYLQGEGKLGDTQKGRQKWEWDFTLFNFYTFLFPSNGSPSQKII